MGLLFGSGFGSGLLYVRASQVHESGGVSVARLKIIDSTPGSVCGFAGRGLRWLALVSVFVFVFVFVDCCLRSARMDEMSVSSCSGESILSVCVCVCFCSVVYLFCPCLS